MKDINVPMLPQLVDLSAERLRERIWHHLIFSIGKDHEAARLSDWRLALSHAIRDQVVLPWFQTTHRVNAEDRKRVYYLSMEFLIGRLLQDATSNLGLEDMAREAMMSLGADYYEASSESTRASIPLGIGESTVIQGAIIDKDCRIGRQVRIINEAGIEDSRQDNPVCVVRDGIPVVTKDSLIEDNSDLAKLLG